MSNELNIYQRLLKITEELKTVEKNLSVPVTKNNSYKAVGERDVILKPRSERRCRYERQHHCQHQKHGAKARGTSGRSQPSHMHTSHVLPRCLCPPQQHNLQ